MAEISFDNLLYPARPRALRPRARLRPQASPTQKQIGSGDADGSNPVYVEWLKNQSMFADAKKIARQFSGQGSMWQNPYAKPNPIGAIETASVWFTAYPISMINKPGQSFLATLGDQELWTAFQQIGIQGLHTGPVKAAGGITGWQMTPSIDGHFDRISTDIDVLFGTEQEFRDMCEVAAEHGGTIIDDIVPGHTGKGADFRLAEMGVDDYPGIYHMVLIPEEDWGLLPEVPEGRDSINLSADDESALAEAGYIIGALQRVIFYAPGVKETNWSVTAPVTGPDGETRRWVYLHYFKEGQPSINWLDPTFAGIRLVFGDALHSLGDLGTGGLRLDANGFLGVEKSAHGGEPAWSEGHPLSEAANQLIGSMVRKVGGFTFQELNLTIDDIKATSEAGADLSYDFVNRPAYHHAMATGDSEFLRITLRESARLGVEPQTLVHALQNHDEMTYELVHFATLHKDEPYTFRGVTLPGEDLAAIIRADLTTVLTGENAPYNRVFTTNGIASTTASIIAASLGYADLSELDDEQIDAIKRAHLLLAIFNAMQPGVFALSGWDLVGALTIDEELVANLTAGGDTRWIHRSAYDLMGYDPTATQSGSGMPRGKALYGTLPAQLADPGSFAAKLKGILEVRDRYGIATATQIDVPDVAHGGMLVMVHQLAAPNQMEVTVLNFAQERVEGSVRSEQFVPGATVLNVFTGEELGVVDQLQTFSVSLDRHEGVAFLLTAPEVDEEEFPTLTFPALTPDPS